LLPAKLYRHRNQLPLAAFMLHQSVEHGLRSLLMLTTGYRTNTHNLDKLLRYCSMSVYKITEIFKGNKHSTTLFYKLRNAYIHARYKKYDILIEELLELEHKVQELMKVYAQNKTLLLRQNIDNNQMLSS
jgi:HEPN domain-containing protein